MMPNASCKRFRWLLAAVVLGILAVSASSSAAETPPPTFESPIAVPNPATDLWRAVRQRESLGGGTTQIRGVETNVLINQSGEQFRQYRREDLISNAGWLIFGVAAAILAFYAVRGRIPIDNGRSGERIRRFADFDRIVHWLTAILFVFLAVTGLILLFGRFVILPVLGPEAFAVIASACKEGHNLFGPLFLVSLVLLFIRFAKKNMPARGDLKWLMRGGGIIGKGHVRAGFFNAGEKIWFWSVVLFGIVVSASGLILDFPVFGQGRDVMQLALVVHGIAAILFIVGSFGHIYIGTIGSEGSLDSMTTGYVDTNWAKTHHDLWYSEITHEALPEESETHKAATESLQPSPDKA